METKNDALSTESIPRLRRSVTAKFFVFTLGIFFNFSGYLVLLGLQSSINIEGGVGAASVTATYATAAVFGVIVTPVLFRHVSFKMCLIFCEVTYLIYILINYYPATYTLIPAGIIVGMGEAVMSPLMLLFCVHYARCYAEYGTRKPSVYIKDFMGIFFFFYQFSWTFGNLLSYGILHGGLQQPDNITNTTNTSTKDLSICGTNDCQLPNVTGDNLDNYVPSSKPRLYILFGVMAGLVLLAMFIHTFFTKNIDPTLEDNESGNEENNNENSKTNEEHEENQSIIKSTYKTTKATMFHLINPKQLLITPFAIYNGFLISFGFLELTRAYASCMFGVEQVGLLSAVLTGSDAVMSFVSCKISNRFGRNFTILLGFLIDIGNYMICLFWSPTESSLWVVYIIFGMVGLGDGIWQPLINEIHGAYFPQNKETAFSVWNMYLIVGIAWQTGWSTSLCVYEKIYFQIALLCFSVICYAVSQRLYYRNTSNNSEEKSVEIFRTAL